MPGVNGFKFLEYIRGMKTPGLRDIPIIVLTGHTDKASVVKAAQLGINGYLSKPISRMTLETRIVSALDTEEKPE